MKYTIVILALLSNSSALKLQNPKGFVGDYDYGSMYSFTEQDDLAREIQFAQQNVVNKQKAEAYKRMAEQEQQKKQDLDRRINELKKTDSSTPEFLALKMGDA